MSIDDLGDATYCFVCGCEIISSKISKNDVFTLNAVSESLPVCSLTCRDSVSRLVERLHPYGIYYDMMLNSNCSDSNNTDCGKDTSIIISRIELLRFKNLGWIKDSGRVFSHLDQMASSLTNYPLLAAAIAKLQQLPLFCPSFVGIINNSITLNDDVYLVNSRTNDILDTVIDHLRSFLCGQNTNNTLFDTAAEPRCLLEQLKQQQQQQKRMVTIIHYARWLLSSTISRRFPDVVMIIKRVRTTHEAFSSCDDKNTTNDNSNDNESDCCDLFSFTIVARHSLPAGHHVLLDEMMKEQLKHSCSPNSILLPIRKRDTSQWLHYELMTVRSVPVGSTLTVSRVPYNQLLCDSTRRLPKCDCTRCRPSTSPSATKSEITDTSSVDQSRVILCPLRPVCLDGLAFYNNLTSQWYCQRCQESWNDAEVAEIINQENVSIEKCVAARLALCTVLDEKNTDEVTATFSSAGSNANSPVALFPGCELTVSQPLICDTYTILKDALTTVVEKTSLAPTHWIFAHLSRTFMLYFLQLLRTMRSRATQEDVCSYAIRWAKLYLQCCMLGDVWEQCAAVCVVAPLLPLISIASDFPKYNIATKYLTQFVKVSGYYDLLKGWVKTLKRMKLENERKKRDCECSNAANEPQLIIGDTSEFERMLFEIEKRTATMMGSSFSYSVNAMPTLEAWLGIGVVAPTTTSDVGGMGSNSSDGNGSKRTNMINKVLDSGLCDDPAELAKEWEEALATKVAAAATTGRKVDVKLQAMFQRMYAQNM